MFTNDHRYLSAIAKAVSEWKTRKEAALNGEGDETKEVEEENIYAVGPDSEVSFVILCQTLQTL